MKTLILLLLLSFIVLSSKSQNLARVGVFDLEGNSETLTYGNLYLDTVNLFTLYPVNQIRNAKAEPLDGKGYFGIRYNSKSIGISEYYSEVGSFVYYKIKEGESIHEALMYRINVIVLTESNQIFYYNFNKQRRGWEIARGKKYKRFRKQFKT